MPFTLAHPAAVVPLRRYFGRFNILSALVIGSITPDLHYFFPLQPERVVTHSLAALFWYCLPFGLVLYVAFHTLLKTPLLMLWPRAVSRRLLAFSSRWPQASWLAVAVALLIGAISHLGWDAFTHGDSRIGRAWPVLRTVIFRIGDDPTRLYDLLQYLGAALGVGLLAWWSWRWLRAATPRRLDAHWLTVPGRTLALASVVGIPMALALAKLGQTALSAHSVAALSAWYSAISLAVSAFGPSVIVYGIAWHLWERRARSASTARVAQAAARPYPTRPNLGRE